MSPLFGEDEDALLRELLRMFSSPIVFLCGLDLSLSLGSDGNWLGYADFCEHRSSCIASRELCLDTSLLHLTTRP